RLTTVSCIASTVVNRRSQEEQLRRRRIDVPSSATRESSTRVSVFRQYGQCIRHTSSCDALYRLIPVFYPRVPTVQTRHWGSGCGAPVDVPASAVGIRPPQAAYPVDVEDTRATPSCGRTTQV